MSRNLLDEFSDLDVDDLRPVAGGAPPPGAKAGEAFAVGALLVSVAPAVVAPLMEVLASWLRRQSVEVEVEIGGHQLSAAVTREQRDAIVAAFLDRARQPGST